VPVIGASLADGVKGGRSLVTTAAAVATVAPVAPVATVATKISIGLL
jgi:hypothetical protein